MTKNSKRIKARLSENLKVWATHCSLIRAMSIFLLTLSINRLVILESRLVDEMMLENLFFTGSRDTQLIGATVYSFQATPALPSYIWWRWCIQRVFNCTTVQVQLHLRRTCVHWSSRRRLPCGDAWCVQGGACFQCTSVHVAPSAPVGRPSGTDVASQTHNPTLSAFLLLGPF